LRGNVCPQRGLYSPYAPPARGRAAKEALHQVWNQEAGGGKQLIVVHAGRSGDLAWCLAAFSEGQVTGDGTSLNIFERHAMEIDCKRSFPRTLTPAFRRLIAFGLGKASSRIRQWRF